HRLALLRGKCDVAKLRHDRISGSQRYMCLTCKCAPAHKELNMISRTLKIFSLAVMTAVLLTPAPAQGQSQQKASPTDGRQTGAAAKASNPPGRIAKFTASGFVGNANITEDSSGKIGIGITLPTSPLTVAGMIETTLGGYKFPDGTMQTTAGLASVF